MGRIGRLLFRRLIHHDALQVVAVNDIMEKENLAYLLKYDSVYGACQDPLHLQNDEIIVAGKHVKVLREENPSRLPWKALGIDIVIEATGRFSSRSGATAHLDAGAARVLLSTTGHDDIPLLIYGFNQHALTAAERIVSPGGCMTNCCTHILYILNSIGIRSVQLNILHSYTSRQELVDAPHTHFRRGRAAGESIIPVEIDLTHSLERLLPAMRDKIAAVSTRVPVANGALADFTVQLEQAVTARDVNRLFSTAAQNGYQGIVQYTEDPLVSQDIKGNPHSCIVDGTLTSVINNHLKLFAWFDNEYGFTTRMIDWLMLMGKQQ